MTLESAIKHCEEVATKMECEAMCVEEAYQTARQTDCEKCAEEHWQLAEWLTDYQRLLKAIDDIRAEIKELHNSHMINFVDADGAVDTCIEIIDRHIGKESE